MTGVAEPGAMPPPPKNLTGRAMVGFDPPPPPKVLSTGPPKMGSLGARPVGARLLLSTLKWAKFPKFFRLQQADERRTYLSAILGCKTEDSDQFPSPCNIL